MSYCLAPLRAIALSSAIWHVALAALLSLPGYADIMSVGFSGSGSGSGTVYIRCDPGTDCFPSFPGVASDSFSFNQSYTSSQPNTFSVSDTASARGTGARVLTATGLVQQNTSFSSEALDFDLTSELIVGAINGAQWDVDASLASSYNLGFTLTTESYAHLTNIVSPYLGTLVATLDTPTGSIDLGHTSDQALILPAGVYHYGFGSHGSTSVGPFTIFNPEQHRVISDVTLHADFTPLEDAPIPEPRWTSITLILLVIGLRVGRRQHALGQL